MRSIAFIWVVALISAAPAQGASAQEKIRLAQSSTVTNCMMNCNAQVTNCRTTCLVPVPATPLPSPSSSPPSTLNATPNTTCLLNCSSVHLTCQSNCALQSPSQ
jgi:hypothetical protein